MEVNFDADRLFLSFISGVLDHLRSFLGQKEWPNKESSCNAKKENI
jgi:hypothetical protein